jgi:queuine/archaeosine tRNA-ribosyltransferase
MPRKKLREPKKENQSDQDILKLYIDGQLEFRKALVNAATAISVQSEISRDMVASLRELINKLDTFEDKLHNLERTVGKFEDNITDLKDASVINLNNVKDSAVSDIQTVRESALKDIGRRKMTSLIMLFFLALAGVLGAYSLAGSKIRTEVSTSGVSVEAKPSDSK